MTSSLWSEFKHIWYVDGSLRDVYIYGTSLKDWETFIEWSSKLDYEYLFDGEKTELPSIGSVFLNRDGCHLLKIKIGKISINCCFHIVSEIELDIDPKEIKNEEDQEILFCLLKDLSHTLNKSVLITPEMDEVRPLAIYDFIKQAWLKK